MVFHFFCKHFIQNVFDVFVDFINFLEHLIGFHHPCRTSCRKSTFFCSSSLTFDISFIGHDSVFNLWSEYLCDSLKWNDYFFTQRLGMEINIWAFLFYDRLVTEPAGSPNLPPRKLSAGSTGGGSRTIFLLPRPPPKQEYLEEIFISQPSENKVFTFFQKFYSTWTKTHTSGTSEHLN